MRFVSRWFRPWTCLLHIIEAYGLWVVFACVLLDQGGLPAPAYPPMIVTAAVAVESNDSLLQLSLERLRAHPMSPLPMLKL